MHKAAFISHDFAVEIIHECHHQEREQWEVELDPRFVVAGDAKGHLVLAILLVFEADEMIFKFTLF